MHVQRDEVSSKREHEGDVGEKKELPGKAFLSSRGGCSSMQNARPAFFFFLPGICILK